MQHPLNFITKGLSLEKPYRAAENFARSFCRLRRDVHQWKLCDSILAAEAFPTTARCWDTVTAWVFQACVWAGHDGLGSEPLLRRGWRCFDWDQAEAQKRPVWGLCRGGALEPNGAAQRLQSRSFAIKSQIRHKPPQRHRNETETAPAKRFRQNNG